MTAIAISLAVMTVLLLIGRFGYGVRISPGTLPGVVLTAVVGAISFCCVGYAFTTVIHNRLTRLFQPRHRIKLS